MRVRGCLKREVRGEGAVSEKRYHPNLQVMAEAATGAVQRWIQLNDEATARIMKREEHIEWLRKLFTGWKEARPALRESRRRRDNGGNVQTGQQPVGRTRAATAAQAGGSGDGGQRAKWVRLMMLLRLRERFSCWAGFRVVLTRKGIDAISMAPPPHTPDQGDWIIPACDSSAAPFDPCLHTRASWLGGGAVGDWGVPISNAYELSHLLDLCA